MFYLNKPSTLQQALPARTTTKAIISKEKFDTLHKRLGHPSATRLKFSLAHELFADIKPTTLKLDKTHHDCIVCDQAKIPRNE